MVGEIAAGHPAREIEPELFERLGRIVVQWSALEALLCTLCGHLLGAHPKLAYALTKSIGGGMLIGWTKVLVSYRIQDEAELEEVNDFLRRLETVQGERNALAHGVWGTDKSEPGSVMVQTVRLERNEIVRDLLITANDLDDLISEISYLHRELTTMCRTAGAIPP